MKTDSQIQTEVMQELRWDASVTHEKIGVAVSDGIVTLSGNVPSFIEKSSAVKAAQRVSEVKAVVEEIEVKLPGIYKRGDQEIAKAIVDQFKWNIQVPDHLIKVNVEDGWVDLTGEVEWDYQRTTAESLVRGTTGVIGVSDNITIKPKVQAADIKEKIETALKRGAEREANHISVQVHGSKVSLSGKVRSFAEMQDARGAAWSAPGVTSVENNLQIQSYR